MSPNVVIIILCLLSALRSCVRSILWFATFMCINWMYFIFFVGSQYITIERWNPSQVFSENAAIHRELPSRVTVFAFRQTCCLLETF